VLCGAEFQQPEKMRKRRRGIPFSRRDEVLHDLPDTTLIEQTLHHTNAEQLFGVAFHSLGDLHRYTTNCLEVISARRRWSSAVRILPVTVAAVCTTNLPTSRLSSTSMRS